MHQELISALVRPEQLDRIGPREWELLIRQGRAAEVLGILASRIATVGLFEKVPELPREHLLSAEVLARRQHTELSHEIQEIQAALAVEGVKCVLLKGAAYVLQGLRAANGRLVSDVDILVPEAQLSQAESGLMKAGWLSTTTNAYDQHYYRTWMHEIPALRHAHRGSVLDVHHSVVPPTAGYGLNVALMLESVVPVTGLENVYVLSDSDMVLHSAVHLMHEGELEMGFRGLLDLDALVTEFAAADPAFWTRLNKRAVQLDLQRPAYLALRYTHLMLETDIPEACLQGLRDQSPRLGRMRLAALDALYGRGLRPHHLTLDDRFSGLSRSILYMRSHLLRMPLHLLLPHLMRKFFMRLQESLKGQKGAKDAQA